MLVTSPAANVVYAIAAICEVKRYGGIGLSVGWQLQGTCSPIEGVRAMVEGSLPMWTLGQGLTGVLS